jgi:hypothetical protein
MKIGVRTYHADHISALNNESVSCRTARQTTPRDYHVTSFLVMTSWIGVVADEGKGVGIDYWGLVLGIFSSGWGLDIRY